MVQGSMKSGAIIFTTHTEAGSMKSETIIFTTLMVQGSMKSGAMTFMTHTEAGSTKSEAARFMTHTGQDRIEFRGNLCVLTSSFEQICLLDRKNRSRRWTSPRTGLIEPSYNNMHLINNA